MGSVLWVTCHRPCRNATVGVVNSLDCEIEVHGDRKFNPVRSFVDDGVIDVCPPPPPPPLRPCPLVITADVVMVVVLLAILGSRSVPAGVGAECARVCVVWCREQRSFTRALISVRLYLLGGWGGEGGGWLLLIKDIQVCSSAINEWMKVG